MDVLQILERSDTVAGLIRDLRRIGKLPNLIKMLSNRDKLITSYLKSNTIKKLHLGAGSISHSGWLDTDIYSELDNVVYLDATHTFPFNDNTFDYILSEHMIEHITWNKGLFMLKECLRILKPRGTVRITTPDLEVLIGLYEKNGNSLNDKYIKWITDTWLNDIHLYHPCFVVNNGFRAWGHQFLYDSDLLAITMKEAGFVDIRQCSPGKSDDDNLVGVDAHGTHVNDVIGRFETMVFEGECPQ